VFAGICWESPHESPQRADSAENLHQQKSRKCYQCKDLRQVGARGFEPPTSRSRSDRTTAADTPKSLELSIVYSRIPNPARAAIVSKYIHGSAVPSAYFQSEASTCRYDYAGSMACLESPLTLRGVSRVTKRSATCVVSGVCFGLGVSKDYERKTSSSEARVRLSAIRRMSRRLKPDANIRQAKL
jgi:hypothetical protein